MAPPCVAPSNIACQIHKRPPWLAHSVDQFFAMQTLAPATSLSEPLVCPLRHLAARRAAMHRAVLRPQLASHQPGPSSTPHRSDCRALNKSHYRRALECWASSCLDQADASIRPLPNSDLIDPLMWACVGPGPHARRQAPVTPPRSIAVWQLIRGHRRYRHCLATADETCFKALRESVCASLLA